MSKGSTATQTFLTDNPNHNRADLITITLKNGDVLRVLCGTNRNITYGGHTYYVSQFGSWTRGAFTGEAAFRPKTSAMELTALLATSGADTVFYPGTSTTLLSVVNSGLFNGAVVNVVSLFWAVNTAPPTSGGFFFTLNTGQIGDSKNTGRSKVTFEVFDMLYILNRPFPPHQIQTQCRHVLFDAGCTLLASNFTSTAQTLDVSSTTLYLNMPVPAHATGHLYAKGNLIQISSVLYFCTVGGTSAGSAPSYNSALGALTTDGGAHFQSFGSMVAGTNSASQALPLGYVTFTGGQNAGWQLPIKVMVVSAGLLQLQLGRPTPLAVAAGDTLTITSGCNKSLAQCGPLYNNTIHFGGMPYVPSPETAGV